MDFIIEIIDIITIFISICITFKAIKNVREGSRYVFLVVFFAVFVVPVALDYIVGQPDYSLTYTMSNYKGFILSQNDFSTRLIYDAFLIITQVIVLKYFPRYRFVIGKSYRTQNEYYQSSEELFLTTKENGAMLLLAAIAPVIALICGFKLQTMFMFGWRELQGVYSYTSTPWYSTVERLSYIGVVASLCGIFLKEYEEKKTNYLKVVLFSVLLYMNLCVESKRSIVFFALIMYFVIKLYTSNSRKGKAFLIIVALGIVATVVLSTVYVKLNVRGYATLDAVYSSLRIDVFRDDTVKMAIYSWLGKDLKPLLDYPFQSYITQIASIFPLDYMTGMGLLPLKRIGFNTYLTSSLIGVSISEGKNFMTTSMFDEMIANFWFVGFIIAGMVLVRGFVKIDKMNAFLKIIWTGGIVLLMFYSLNYIMYYIELAFIFTIFSRNKMR